jgi:hypothetical protein
MICRMWGGGGGQWFLSVGVFIKSVLEKNNLLVSQNCNISEVVCSIFKYTYVICTQKKTVYDNKGEIIFLISQLSWSTSISTHLQGGMCLLSF